MQVALPGITKMQITNKLNEKSFKKGIPEQLGFKIARSFRNGFFVKQELQIEITLMISLKTFKACIM